MDALSYLTKKPESSEGWSPTNVQFTFIPHLPSEKYRYTLGWKASEREEKRMYGDFIEYSNPADFEKVFARIVAQFLDFCRLDNKSAFQLTAGLTPKGQTYS